MKTQFDATTQEYIEIIHELQKNDNVARVKDIAEKRGVTRSSVSTALNILKKKKLIVHENYGQVQLTREGQRLGQELEECHNTIKRFLIQILGVHGEQAEVDACKIEHYISDLTVKRLLKFVRLVEECPCGNPRCLDFFSNDSEKTVNTSDATESCQKK
ncbi:metal-dependent transcriptional regulator [candidate division KSB1 bacterium]|nr:metal-dependent transcriptional regulator [candidate division KSB1 bacterium]